VERGGILVRRVRARGGEGENSPDRGRGEEDHPRRGRKKTGEFLLTRSSLPKKRGRTGVGGGTEILKERVLKRILRGGEVQALLVRAYTGLFRGSKGAV